MKQIKEDTNRWKDIFCSWIGRINTVKITILPKAIYRFHVTPMELPRTIFMELEQNILQFLWNHKRPWRTTAILVGGGVRKQRLRNHSPWLQTILQSCSNQEMWYWNQNRNIDQWNKIERPEINQCTYSHLIYDKEGKNIQWRKDSLFNKWCWED